MSQIVPAILTDDENIYREQLQKAEHVSNLIQIDVIDGKFAKNTTVGTDVIAKYSTSSNLEIQLMVNEPQEYIDQLLKIDYVTKIIFPLEIDANHRQIIYSIKNQNRKVGISLNPSTPLSEASEFLEGIDLLLFLAVEPGFSGQKFKEQVLQKIKESKNMAPSLAVELDGGVTFENIRAIADAGTDFIAANSVIFKAPDFMVAYEKLAKLVE